MNGAERAAMPATAAAAGLANLPIGSLKSRAAARLLLAHRRASERRFEVILCDDSIDKPAAREWERCESEGMLTRTVFLPGGQLMEECLRQIGDYSEEEIREIVNQDPIVPAFEIIMLDR